MLHINPEVTDYYIRMSVCLCVSVCLCALNTAKNAAYPYARTVSLTCIVLYRTVPRGTVPYGTVLVPYLI